MNYKYEIQHDSAMCFYREPAGALKTGEAAALRIRIRAQGIQSVYLRLFNAGHERHYPMTQTGDVWSAEVTAPQKHGVYWYYFIVSIEGRIFYYGAEANRTSGLGSVYTEIPPAYQMTVYDARFQTPKWFVKTVLYQIFPDRFRRAGIEKVRAGLECHRSMGRKAVFHENWNEPPLYRPHAGQEDYAPDDYFGGTLKGIEESLPYLKELGVGTVYLNPVFEAASNHRYNTADYCKIDPILGTNEDFRELCAKAREIGIRVILDAVFSHTGSDSVYFNREGAYESAGAYNSPDSPYYGWYKFRRYPDDYECWWGFKTLPEVNEHNPDWQRFIIKGEDSVLRRWLIEGASGYRLDVADEIPDDVLELIRSAVKEQDREAVIIGEVWEDATTKSSYGQRREYALGRSLDSVTNYPFRNAAAGFLTGRTNAAEFKDFLVSQAVNYPKPMYYALMNLLSSHDIERIRTALSVKINPHELTREQQAVFLVSQAQDAKGARLQRLAAAIQAFMPGVPCIYYGDETGMQGFLDPFNRAPFAKGGIDLTELYKKLLKIRNTADALSAGHAAFFAPHPDCLGILRYILHGRDALGEPAQNGVYFTAVNRSGGVRRVVFDLLCQNQLISEADKKALRLAIPSAAENLLNGDPCEVNDALIEISLQPYEAVVLKIL